MENTPLRKFIRDPSGVFFILSLPGSHCMVRILMTAFRPAFSRLFEQTGSVFLYVFWSIYFCPFMRLFVKYCFYHSQIKFISSHCRLISSVSRVEIKPQFNRLKLHYFHLQIRRKSEKTRAVYRIHLFRAEVKYQSTLRLKNIPASKYVVYMKGYGVYRIAIFESCQLIHS